MFSILTRTHVPGLLAGKVLQLKDDETGVEIQQPIEVGFSGFASRLDCSFRRRFAAAKDEHVRTEFPNKFRDFLRQMPQRATLRTGSPNNGLYSVL